MSPSLEFYAASWIVMLFVSLMKGAFGGGFALIAVPIMSLYVPPMYAAAIVAPLVCLMDVFALIAYPPRTWNKRVLRIIVPGALGGMAIGTFLLGRAPETWIGTVVGAVAVCFAAQWFLTRFRTPGTRFPAKPATPAWGYFWGGVSGFTSLLAHAGGPPLSVYLLPQELPKTELAGTQTVFFTIGNFTKLVPYMLLGILGGETLLPVAIIAPSVPLGVGLGRMLHGRLDQDRIYLISYAIVFVAGTNLLYRAATQVGS